MALVLIEGFDFYNAADLTTRGWTGAGNTLTGGRFGAQALAKSGDSSGVSLTSKPLPAALATVICGFAFKPSGGPSGVTFFQYSGSGGNIARLRLNGTTGKIEVVNSSGTVIATGSAVFTSGVWHYVEFKLFVNGASGTCEVHVDGATDISSTTGNFGSTNVDTINFTENQNFVSTIIDDVYVCDTTGSHNNSFLGDVRVETLYPTGDGAHTQWTPDSGTSHYARVDETYADGDSSYVADNTVGDRDSYTFGDLSSLLGTVYGVQTNLQARKDDVGTRQICAVARPVATDRDGATVTLSTSYQFFSEIRETNPDTSSPWTIGDVNGSEFGVKVVA